MVKCHNIVKLCFCIPYSTQNPLQNLKEKSSKFVTDHGTNNVSSMLWLLWIWFKNSNAFLGSMKCFCRVWFCIASPILRFVSFIENSEQVEVSNYVRNAVMFSQVSLSTLWNCQSGKWRSTNTIIFTAWSARLIVCKFVALISLLHNCMFI